MGSVRDQHGKVQPVFFPGAVRILADAMPFSPDNYKPAFDACRIFLYNASAL